MTRLMRVADVEPGDLPVRRSTLYHWSSIGRYPELFTRIGSRMLFVDTEALDRLLEANRGLPRRNKVRPA